MIIHPAAVKAALSAVHLPIHEACPPLPGFEKGGKQPAAVLIPLLNDRDTWKILFIKRTHHQADRHSGQIAFPGGRAEPGDSHLLATALRETEEEIGIHPPDIQILGQSCPITTVTDYQVTPFVGILPWPTRLQLSPDEVEKTVIIPLGWLNDPENREVRSWQSSRTSGKKMPVIFFREYGGEVLWGASAQIVVDFLDLVRAVS